MRLAPEGVPFVLGFFLAAAAAAFLLAVPFGAGAGAAVAIVSPLILLGLFSAWFFRDPERAIPEGPGLVVSPADGKVVAVVDGPDGPSVAIFLNVFDVHVNRAPVGGTVESVTYRRGSFLAAFDERAGDLNEQNEVVLDGPSGRVRVRQIAGLIARRIVCRVKPGDRLRAGDRFGLIRFGSRTDLRLPRGAEILVRVGERVKGGASVIGRMPALSGTGAEPGKARRETAGAAGARGSAA